MKTILPVLVILLSGCLLDPTECGPSFDERNGRCVPMVAPLDFSLPRADQDLVLPPPSDSSFSMDATNVVDAGISVDASSVPDMAAAWVNYRNLLLVDRTSDTDVRRTPALPGADIDGVLIHDERGNFVGTGQSVVDARINDPFDANIQLDPRAALLRPDSRAVSLGTQGGFVRLGLELSRPLQSGDLIEVSEIRERMDDTDRFEAFLCRTDADGLRGCVILGIGLSGTTTFLVPSID